MVIRYLLYLFQFVKILFYFHIVALRPNCLSTGYEQCGNAGLRRLLAKVLFGEQIGKPVGHGLTPIVANFRLF